MVDVDELAQEIRRVDGNHDKGAGALAEALLPFLTAALAAAPVGVKETPAPVTHVAPEIDGGRFEEWSLADFAAQCRMQSREQLDPEFSRFMAALAKRLSSLAAAPVGVKVKALEWVEHGDRDFVWHRANPPIGPRYNIEDDGFSEKKNHLTVGQLVLGNFDTPEAAKAAAQADYDARIRSALETPSPVTHVDVRRSVLECLKDARSKLTDCSEIDLAYIDEVIDVAEVNVSSDAVEALEECEEYFDSRADADCDQDGFQPNREMEMLSKVKNALEHMRVTKPVTFPKESEAQRLRRMVERRDEFIIGKGLRDEFKGTSDEAE